MPFEASSVIAALGGSSNIINIEACSSRLRVEVKSQNGVDELGLRQLGFLAVVRSANVIQLVIELDVDELAVEMARIVG